MLKDNINCPTCDSKANLKKNSWGGFSNSPQITFFYNSLVYCCDVCGGRYTTTESDTITMNWHDIEKRRSIRKYKIIKFNEYLW